MSRLSDNIQLILQKKISTSDELLRETGDWIEKFEAAGINVTDLKSKQAVVERKNEQLRMLS